MYAEIHSKSEVNEDSSGKKSWVSSNKFEVELLTTAPDHLSNPPWHIVIKAQMLDIRGPDYNFLGMFGGGGTDRTVNRKLEIQFTPEDLSRLLEFATANKLLAIRAKA